MTGIDDARQADDVALIERLRAEAEAYENGKHTGTRASTLFRQAANAIARRAAPAVDKTELDRLREALVAHNCGTPGCLCYQLCRTADREGNAA